MARRDDREYRAIFEGGATQPAAGVPAARFPARWGGAGMHRRPNGVPSAAAALGAPNAAGLSPRAVKPYTQRGDLAAVMAAELTGQLGPNSAWRSVTSRAAASSTTESVPRGRGRAQ